MIKPLALFASIVIVGLSLANAQETTAIAVKGDPYPLATCALTGRPLGDASVIMEDGREIRFCCPNCVTVFNADPAASLEKIDAAIIADQVKVYPRATTCVVMTDNELSDPQGPEAGEDQSIVVNNRLFRICCKKCTKKIKADVAKFTAALDAQVIAEQSATYPLTTCPVSGKKLEADSTNVVIANRLFKVCCSKCPAAIRKDPAKYIAQIDAARAAAQPAK
ncbi:MAG: hypothetical protein O2800_03220 [Planctomycetota bacterium]|nr:hypothetical protein [Planctomycetota bacterium]